MTQIGSVQGDDRRDRKTYAIIGAAMEVHRVLGSKFLEPVYQSALAWEFDTRGVTFLREVALPIYYKGTMLNVGYRADFVCFDEVLVELKAIDRLTSREEGQVINYLAASLFGRGLLLNFGAASLQFKRCVGPSVESVKSVGGCS